MANIIAKYEKGKIGAVGGYKINQLYACWNVSEKTTLTLGRFNTYLGYEVISPTGNFNYSTSYLFSNGSFSHVGLKADFELSDDFILMLAFMNPTDVNNNATGAYALDYTGGFDVSDEFCLGINATYADNDGNGFYGAALYLQYNFSETFALGLRGDYFGTFVDVNGIDNETVFATILSANYKVDYLTIIPEVRLDNWSKDTYVYSDF